MKSKSKFLAGTVAGALLGALVVLGSYHYFVFPQLPITSHAYTSPESLPIQVASLTTANIPTGEPNSGEANFVHAAQIATPAVVHIKAKYEAKVVRTPGGSSPLDRLFKEFFGEEFDLSPREYKSQPQQGIGSGVIIAEDGYIVTNNHVIEGAEQIEVTLDDNRRYIAQVVGQDADTDLALLKVKEKGLPSLVFGNSDKLQVGEWILAVGNPFNLTSTVTKGIVSAKARTINALQSQGKVPIEAFIQTDAAVNKGNSGGALVNLYGELVGINTAIAAPAGVFAGYAFAIPSSIVEKVITDLKKYGAVQRAMLGVAIRNVDADLAEEKGLKQLNGVYIAEVNKNGAAAEAGLQVGDVIVAINGNKVKNTSQLQEQITRYKPNDEVQVTFYRKTKEKTIAVRLKEMVDNKLQIVSNENTVEVAGAVLENTDEATQKQLNITGGVRIRELKEGLWKQAGIQKGFVITAIDKQEVKDLIDLTHILTKKKEGILVEGFYQKGKKHYYGVDFSIQ